jgi:hypothetical protein
MTKIINDGQAKIVAAMLLLKEGMQDLKQKRKNNVKRNDKAYAQALSTVTEEIDRLLVLYRTTVFEDDMRARLLRDMIDFLLRRYHKYAIQGKIKSHYYQKGVSLKPEDTIFEHVIPAATVRDKLIEGTLSINQALNVPTCRIARTTDLAIRRLGLHDNTPDGWCFFKRYNLAVADIEIDAYNGQPVTDLDTWTLQDHFDFFGIV